MTSHKIEIPKVTVIGAGLAGCEAAWQLAQRNISVTLVEMKPNERTGAHHIDGLAELVCSNSLRGAGLSSAVGLLKEELRSLGSLLIAMADKTSVRAGRALAVDRNLFSQAVEESIKNHPLIEIEHRRVDVIPSGQVIVATGPLTAGPLAQQLTEQGAWLHYHDAIAPLVNADSLDMTKVFRASRYEEPGDDGDYLNCPMNAEQYHEFVNALVNAEKTPLHEFETAPFFEGCLPVEELASRGPKTLNHGPLKPVGLTDPSTGRWPYAVVQLRQEDEKGTAYNLVGFQTRLTRPEQKRVLRTIPGLEKVVFERYGQIHRNSFVNAPTVLDDKLRLKDNSNVTLAGQLAGVEGYVESMASGLLSSLFVVSTVLDKPMMPPPQTTAIGGLYRHLRDQRMGFQPSNVVWAMIDHPSKKRGQGKKERRELAAQKALEDLLKWSVNYKLVTP